MLEERFTKGNSFVHKRDPRIKIVVATLFTVTVALLHSIPALLTSLLVSAALLFSAKLPLADVAKRLLVINGFTLFIWITLPLTYGGEVKYQAGFMEISQGGIHLALLITLKTNAIVAALIPLLATSTIAELGHALEKLHFPQKLCFILLFSYRYVFVIYQEYMRLLRAAKMRSFSPGTNLHTYKTYSYLFGMTLVKSYNRSQRVYQAMLLRGFDGRLISLRDYQYSTPDIVFLLSVIVCIAGIIVVSIV